MGSLRERIERHPGLNEVLGLSLLLLAVLSLAALVSYDPADPSYGFHARPDSGETANWIGRVGATLAEGLLQLFGTVAFLSPLGLGFLGWTQLRRQVVAGWQTAAAGLVLAFSLCSLLDLAVGQILYRGQLLPAGGYLGDLAGAWLVALFNTSGAVLVSVMLLIAVVILSTRLSFVRSVELAVHWARVGTGKLLESIGEMVGELRKRAADRRAARPHDNAHSRLNSHS